MIKKEKNKKRFKVHRFDYKNRTHLIEQMHIHPEILTLETGFHLSIDKKTWNVKSLSAIQKNLKQKLFNFLSKNEMPNDNYILNVDGPVNASGQTVFISMLLTMPVLHEDSLQSNVEYCCKWIDELYAAFNFTSYAE